MNTRQRTDRQAFEAAIRALESESYNVGVHLTMDSTARLAYTRQIQVMSNELRMMASSGRITWAQAAQQACEARNVIMNIIRVRSTPVGLSIAQKMKRHGKTLNELVALKTQQLYGATTSFSNLTLQHQNDVFSQIVKSAGKSRPEVTAVMKNLSHAGRGLIILSVAVSVYTVVTADNKFDAAGKEIVITGASITGGVAGGALAGLACGPGAPVCVTVGAFAGGALAAFGIGLAW